MSLSPSSFTARRLARLAGACLIGLAAASAQAATPAELLAGYAAEAGAAPDAQRGRVFFTSRHGQEWTCATCHGNPPTGDGRHETTGKAIRPLAPAFNAERFTDRAKANKWFRRNCKDVVGRECSPSEKADVLAWLNSVK
jgi:cytochrome c553